MKKYIDKAKVEEMLESAQLISDGEYCGYCTEDVNLNSIAVDDVVEVQHGRWSPVAFGIGICTTKYRCSICKQYENVDRPYKYCPNCGARMDAEGDEHEVD